MEILVAGAIGGVMVAGHMKTLQLSLESNLVAKSSLAEADLHYTIGQALQGQDCLANFKTKTQADPNPYAQGLYGDDREWGIGEVFQLKKGGTVVLEKGEDFKRILEIVKMSLKGDPNPKDDSTNITKGATATRQFVVYYKKVGLGGYSTLAGEPCDKDKLQGCYFNQCGVRLKESPGDPVCVKLDCANYGSQGSGGGGNPDCYHVDKTDSASGAKTIVGCGERNTTIAGRITAIGFGAGGKNSSGLGQNVFIGYGAGYENTTAGANTLIGYQAGYSNTVGENNTIIGYSSGLLNTSGANNTIIGKGAGYYNKTSGRNTFIGNNAGFRVTGEKNTFIGDHAGSLVTTGTKNIAIGQNALLESATGNNQINIGNIIKANRDTDPDDTTKKMGVLKICNPGAPDGDGKCIELSKKSLKCPDNYYFKGINDDGTPKCQQERCTPQTGLYFWKPENQCHHCPRASPLYRSNASPPDCVPCFSNSRYILASNKCQSICPSYQTNVGGVCTCPQATPHNTGSACVTCTGGRIWNSTERRCECTGNKRWVQTELACMSCSGGGAYWRSSGSGYQCTCPRSSPHLGFFPSELKKSGSAYTCKCAPERPHLYTENNKCYKCPKTDPAEHQRRGTCHPCLGGYFNLRGWMNCACNDPTHFWHGTQLKCKPCGTPAEIRWGSVEVGSDWKCHLSCNRIYPVIRMINISSWMCCPESGDCCRTGDYFEDGKCKRRVGNRILECPEGEYAYEGECRQLRQSNY